MCAEDLLGLFGSGSTTLHVAVDVSLVVNSLEKTLGSLPSLTGSWWNVLALGESVTACAQLLDHALHEGALADACAEEDGVENEDDPAPLDEDDG